MQAISTPFRWIKPINRVNQTATFSSEIISALNWKVVYFQTNVTNQAGLVGNIQLFSCADVVFHPPGTFSPYPAAPIQVFAGNGAYTWDVTATGAPYFKIVVTITGGSADFDIITFMKV